MADSSDPLDGWTYSEIMKTAGPAKNDLYGGLYIYVKNLLLRFCEGLSRLLIRFHLTHAGISQLPGILEQHGVTRNSFDRIEVPFLSLSHTMSFENQTMTVHTGLQYC